MAANTRIYIVEDEAIWATTLTSMLGKRFDCTVHSTGEAALANIAQDKPAIFILDYQLEGKLTGLDVLREIRKLLPAAYVVMFSAQESVQVAVDVLDGGAYDYVVKHQDAMERLKIILRNILQEQQLQRSVIELRIRIKRWQLALYALVVSILLMSTTIYLHLCPNQRALKWDPFGVETSAQCNPS